MSRSSKRSSMTDTTPRRWPALVCVALGLLSFSLWPLASLIPEHPQVMLLYMAAMYGPMIASALLLIWWLVLGPVGFRARLLSVVFVLGIGAAALFASSDKGMTRFFLVILGLPGALGAVALF